MSVHTSYLEKLFDTHDRSQALDRAEKMLAMTKVPFDAIAGRGTSGIFAAILADRLKKGFIYVRKQTEDAHYGYNIEGSVGVEVQRYLIVDDFICSGDTVRNIVTSIEQYCMSAMGILKNNRVRHAPTPVALYTYAGVSRQGQTFKLYKTPDRQLPSTNTSYATALTRFDPSSCCIESFPFDPLPEIGFQIYDGYSGEKMPDDQIAQLKWPWSVK